jgi:hypothetical protein
VSKFIIRGAPGSVADSAAQLRDHPTVRIVETTPKMLLVEADSEDQLRSAMSAKDLMIFPEQEYKLPDARPTLKR